MSQQVLPLRAEFNPEFMQQDFNQRLMPALTGDAPAITPLSSMPNKPVIQAPTVQAPIAQAPTVSPSTGATTMPQPVPQPAPKEEKGFFGGLMDKIGEVTSDPNFRDRLIIAAQGLTMNPNQALIEMAQSNIQSRKNKAEAVRTANKTAEYLRSMGYVREADAIDKDPTMAKMILADVQARRKAGIESSQTYQKEVAKSQAKAAVNLPTAINQAQRSISTIDRLLSIPNDKLANALGPIERFMPSFRDETIRTESIMDSVESQAFINAFESLKGAGQITEKEGEKASQALATLNRAMSPEAYKDAVKLFRNELIKLIDIAQSKAGQAPTGSQLVPQAPTSAGQVDTSGFEYLGIENE
jgi:hypothetical protein